MTIFDNPRGRVIDANSSSAIRLIGLAILALVLIVLLFNSITRVRTGHVGVLTLFGKVTGETLGGGLHALSPLKTNNEMSIQTQTIKESASVPSSEGLIMSMDTSLIYHLNPMQPRCFRRLGRITRTDSSNRSCVQRSANLPPPTVPMRSTRENVNSLQNRFSTSSLRS
jgi:regulator of protease activity HflC (stomatin/prohibitin superfamily)